MNHRVFLLFAPFVIAMLLLAGCQHNDQFAIPVTGGEDVPIPALVETTKENVLEYLASSSRLAALPPGTDWQLDDWKEQEGEYLFHSNDWSMVIWFDGINDEKLRVVILNKVKNTSWCGYVESDGHVVDTSWIR